jgi:hypothetical protein
MAADASPAVAALVPPTSTTPADFGVVAYSKGASLLAAASTMLGSAGTQVRWLPTGRRLLL